MKDFFQQLIDRAREARLKAYTPYSQFRVGSAVLTENGTIFTGCNIENASLGITICAERVAIYKAISEGFKNIKAIAIIGDTEDPCPPCGACRQVMMEFAPNMDVIMSNLQNKVKIRKARELLPDAFNGSTFHQ
ncbi:MAG: cytidine deaminase [Atribacterota bacterium]|jgi:cytidine deaminase|nr:cytidine deaminase [Atribacterota bacterium]MDD4896024.1 cytidine deaminase [Atribacterota bacterium]MDD5638043.1 cytidine deaminase [Atribacterota bacterium]